MTPVICPHSPRLPSHLTGGNHTKPRVIKGISEFCPPQSAPWPSVIQSLAHTIFIYPIPQFPNFSWHCGKSSGPTGHLNLTSSSLKISSPRSPKSNMDEVPGYNRACSPTPGARCLPLQLGA